MCQLLGMNCNTPTDVTFSFAGFAQRGGRTDLHADGWGDLAFASNDDDDGDVELYAGPLGGNVSPTSATHIRTASYAHVGPSSDFDGDGAPDLAISDAVGLHIVLGSAL